MSIAIDTAAPRNWIFLPVGGKINCYIPDTSINYTATMMATKLHNDTAAY